MIVIALLNYPAPMSRSSPDLEELKVSVENERSRVQNQLRDLEKEQLQTEHKVQSLQEDLQRTQAAGTQQQAEEKELQARLLNEVEERERSHQEVHQLRKQVGFVKNELFSCRFFFLQNMNPSVLLSHTNQKWDCHNDYRQILDNCLNTTLNFVWKQCFVYSMKHI